MFADQNDPHPSFHRASPGSAVAQEGERMTEIMIVGSSQVLTASGVDGTENHLRFGAENDKVTLIRRTWKDIGDMFDDAVAMKKRYAIKHFIVAPYRPMSRRLMLTVALPAIAKEFQFDPLLCSVVEHEKDRADPAAFNVHWHVVTTHFNPDTKHVIDWWQDYMRQEKIGRILEYQLWLLDPDRDPAGPDFLIGRHHDAVCASLRDKTTPEYHPIADALERAHPLGSIPEGTAPAANVVRMHAREGRDIVHLRKVCNILWKEFTASIDHIADKSIDRAAADELAKRAKNEFENRMEAEQLFVTLGDKPPPRWMVKDRNGKVLGTLAEMTHAKLKDIYSKMGDPKNDDFYADYAGTTGRADSGGYDVDPPPIGGPPEGQGGIVENVPPMEHEPDRHHGGNCTPGLFVSALKRADPARVADLKARAVKLAESATSWAIRYLKAAEDWAHDYLLGWKNDSAEVSGALAKLRKEKADLDKKLKDADQHLAKAKKAHLTEVDREIQNEIRLADAGANLHIVATAWQKLKDAIEKHEKVMEDPEAKYAAEDEHHKATKVVKKYERAHRFLRVIPRSHALIDKVPGALWMGIEAIFTRGLEEDRKAAKDARWRVNPPPPPPAAEDSKPPGSTM
jgi:hypothetical protein